MASHGRGCVQGYREYGVMCVGVRVCVFLLYFILQQIMSHSILLNFLHKMSIIKCELILGDLYIGIFKKYVFFIDKDVQS
jgi:hypothetical protein